MSMITATAWVPRGAAAPFPKKYDIGDDELARISKLAKIRLDDAKEDLKPSPNGTRHDSEVVEDDDDSEMEDVEHPEQPPSKCAHIVEH